MIEKRSIAELEPSPEMILDSWTDEIVPATVELINNNRYSPRYAWMFSYEKGVKARLESSLRRPLGSLERRLFGADGAVSEALSNAFLHGHSGDAARAISVRWMVSKEVILISVEDGGPGFDVAAVVAKMRQGGSFFHIAGNGLRALDSARDVVAAFDRCGRRILLRVAVNQGDRG